MNGTSEPQSWVNFFYDRAHPRIRDKFMMGNPYMVLLAYAFYFIFCTKILPKIMEKRQGFSFKNMMAIVDTIILMRGIYFLINTALLIGNADDFVCWRLQAEMTVVAKQETNFCWQFVVSEYVYTLQTVIAVLGKKENHPVSSYILYHHLIFPLILWCGVNFYPGGHSIFPGLANMTTHAVISVARIYKYWIGKGWIARNVQGIDRFVMVRNEA
jgi:hypothetical protein